MCPGNQPAMQNTATALAMRMMRTIQAKISSPLMAATSYHRLWLREFPRAVQDLRPGAIKAHHVIPAGHGRQAIGNFPVATAELDGDRTVLTFLGGDIVERVRVIRVLLEIAVGVIDADRPEAVDGDIPDVQPVHCVAVILRRKDVEVLRFLVGISAP